MKLKIENAFTMAAKIVFNDRNKGSGGGWHRDSINPSVKAMLYLNDVDEGGETEFWGTLKVKPEAGKLILFPATWTYPHCANIPISNAKYIITGWLCADM